MARKYGESYPFLEEDPYGLDEDDYGLEDDEEEDTPEITFGRDRPIDWGDLPDDYEQ